MSAMPSGFSTVLRFQVKAIRSRQKLVVAKRLEAERSIFRGQRRIEVVDPPCWSQSARC
jgi:hypothetical protein